MRDCLHVLFEELRRDIRKDPTLMLMFTTPIAFTIAMALIVFAHVS